MRPPRGGGGHLVAPAVVMDSIRTHDPRPLLASAAKKELREGEVAEARKSAAPIDVAVVAATLVVVAPAPNIVALDAACVARVVVARCCYRVALLSSARGVFCW